MPVPVPNLDDRTFDQLVTEARTLIPKHFPAWTDHNLSDPGITLLELFAFFFEAAIYQINRVPERSVEHFAALVDVTRKPGEVIESTLRRALKVVADQYRAVTAEEFERLAKRAVPPTAPIAIARAKAVVEVVDTLNVFPNEQFIKVIIVPNEPHNPAPTPTSALRQTVFEFLRPRCLITTRLVVVPPTYTRVHIATTVVRDFRSRLDKGTVEQALRGFLSPLIGGEDGTGWEFGRPVFRSELYQLIEGIAGVDHVQHLLLNGDESMSLPLSAPTALVRLDEVLVTVVDT